MDIRITINTDNDAFDDKRALGGMNLWHREVRRILTRLSFEITPEYFTRTILDINGNVVGYVSVEEGDGEIETTERLIRK